MEQIMYAVSEEDVPVCAASRVSSISRFTHPKNITFPSAPLRCGWWYW